MLGKPNLSWATIFPGYAQRPRVNKSSGSRAGKVGVEGNSPWMLLRDLRLKHQVRFGYILMYSFHIYESFVGSPREGIVCAELQGIQKAACQWLKLCFLPMAPRWGGLGYVGVVGICWSRSCKLCLSSQSFEQYNVYQYVILECFWALGQGQQFKSHQKTDSPEQKQLNWHCV